MDAALAAAAVLPVVEPNLNGLGGDCFAIVVDGAEPAGLNGSGRSPAVLDDRRVDRFGPRSVTVPGAVAAWFDLAERYGRLGLDRALAHAAELAERGVAATARVAARWQLAEAAGRAPFPAPPISRRYRLPELAATLRRIAADGPDAFYGGEVARAIASVTWLTEEDLAAHRSEWVEPLRIPFGGAEVCELPPNTQGAAALAALALAGAEQPDGIVERLDSRIRAAHAGLAAAYAQVGDEPLPPGFFDLVRLRAVPGPARRRGRRHHLPLRRRRRPHGRLAHPEHLRGLRLRPRGARHRRRAAQPRGRLRRDGGAPEPAAAGPAPVPHDHPRDAAARRAARPRSG